MLLAWTWRQRLFTLFSKPAIIAPKRESQAKTSALAGDTMAKEKKASDLSFEEKLERLQALSDEIKNPGTGLENALAIFEEGISLAKSLEDELNRIESKIQILINSPQKPDDKPELDLFSTLSDE